MNRERALLKNTIIIAIGTILPKMTTFITLPVITASLTQIEYGTYDLITTLVFSYQCLLFRYKLPLLDFLLNTGATRLRQKV